MARRKQSLSEAAKKAQKIRLQRKATKAAEELATTTSKQAKESAAIHKKKVAERKPGQRLLVEKEIREKAMSNLQKALEAAKAKKAKKKTPPKR